MKYTVTILKLAEKFIVKLPKSEKERVLKNTQYNILKNIDLKEEMTKEDYTEEDEEELKDLIQTITNTSMLNKIKDEDLFQRAFLNDVCLRDSCYNCSFKKPNRVSDITLADFWGIKKIIPDMYSGKGVSLMVINSNKGLKLLSMIKDNCIMRKLSEEEFAEALNYNKGYLKSAKRNPNRERFFEQLESDKFNKTVFDNIPNNMIKRSKTKIKNVIKRFIYKVIK